MSAWEGSAAQEAAERASREARPVHSEAAVAPTELPPPVVGVDVGEEEDGPITARKIPLNPNIRFTVKYLQNAGFNTVDSGDGKTGECECDRPYAYVSIRVPSHRLLSEADRLYDLLKTVGVNFNDMDDEGGHPVIQASYDPVDGTAIVDLMYLDDDHFRAVGCLDALPTE